MWRCDGSTDGQRDGQRCHRSNGQCRGGDANGTDTAAGVCHPFADPVPDHEFSSTFVP